MKVSLADLAQRALHWRHHRRNNDVMHLAGRHAVHLEEIDEQNAVLVGRLRTMCGDAPVRSQLGLLASEPVKSQHRIRIAHIDCKKHDSLSFSQRREYRPSAP